MMLTFHRVSRKKLWLKPSATRLYRLAERKAKCLMYFKDNMGLRKKHLKIKALVKILGLSQSKISV